jgi:hypothetical protein
MLFALVLNNLVSGLPKSLVVLSLITDEQALQEVRSSHYRISPSVSNKGVLFPDPRAPG